MWFFPSLPFYCLLAYSYFFIIRLGGGNDGGGGEGVGEGDKVDLLVGGEGGKVLGGVDNDGSNNNKRVIGRSMQVFHDTVPVEQLSLVGSSRDTACGYLCGVVLLYHIICVVLSFFLPVICSTKSLFPLIGGWP